MGANARMGPNTTASVLPGMVMGGAPKSEPFYCLLVVASDLDMCHYYCRASDTIHSIFPS